MRCQKSSSLNHITENHLPITTTTAIITKTAPSANENTTPPNRSAWTKLLKMCAQDVTTISTMEDMFVYKKDVNTPSISSGSYPLHFASMSSTTKLASLLIACGAMVRSGNYRSETPLHWSALHGSIDVVSLLLRANGSACAKDQDGNTPLHWAAERHDDVRAVMKKLKKNCILPINQLVNYSGDNPLHAAIRCGNGLVVAEILPCCIDEKSLDLALEYEELAVIYILSKHIFSSR